MLLLEGGRACGSLTFQVAGARFLSRVLSEVKLNPLWRQFDGSHLAHICASEHQRGKRAGRLSDRVIDYGVISPTLPGHGPARCLMTTLLEPDQYPALEWVCGHGER